MRKTMRKMKRRRSGIQTRKRGGNKGERKPYPKYKGLSKWEETVMKKQFNTVDKAIKELNRMTSEFCADSKITTNDKKERCSITINALKLWLDELVEKNPPSFNSMTIQTISEEEWKVEELEKEIRDLPAIIRKKELVRNSLSTTNNSEKINAIQTEIQQYENKLNNKLTELKIAVNALEKKRRANRASATYESENKENPLPSPRGSLELRNVDTNYNPKVPYSLTTRDGYVPRPSVNSTGTRHATVWLPSSNSIPSGNSYIHRPNVPIVFKESNQQKHKKAQALANAWLKKHNPQQEQHSVEVKPLYPPIGYNQLPLEEQKQLGTIAAESKKQHNQFISNRKKNKYYASLVPIKERIYALMKKKTQPFHNQEQIQREIDELTELGRKTRSETNATMKSLYHQLDGFNPEERNKLKKTLRNNNNIAQDEANNKTINKIRRTIEEIKASNKDGTYWKLT